MKLLASLLLASLVSTSAAIAAVGVPTSETSNPATTTEIIVTDSLQTQRTQYYYYNFGTVGLNWRESQDFVVRNRSSHSIYFNNITISGSAYSSYSGCPYRLYPGQSCATRVDFIPWFEGYHYGRLGFWLNSGSIIIDLQGYGRRW